MSESVLRKRRLLMLRHPLTILLIGTALSSWLIPYFSARLDHEKLIREARLRKATEIIEDNKETERNLNRLLTTLEMFHKDNSGSAARASNYKKEQRELRRIMAERYLEFDRQGWWWYSQIYDEAKILEIVSPHELERLGQISQQYSENIGSSVGAVDGLWSLFLRETYVPSEPKNLELMKQTRSKLESLNRERSKLVFESAQIFSAH
jgi:hypothetical protein